MKGNTRGRANKGKVQSEEQKQAHSARMTGRRHSEETRARQSASIRAALANRTPAQRERHREALQRASFKPTGIERWLHEFLDSEGIAFAIHPWVRVVYEGERRVLRPDVLVPAANLVIEVNGCYWHGCEPCYGERGRVERRLDDALREVLLEEQGYRVLFLWEHEINGGSGADIVFQALDQK